MATSRSSEPKKSKATAPATSQDTAPALGALHLSPNMVTISTTIGSADSTTLAKFNSGPISAQ